MRSIITRIFLGTIVLICFSFLANGQATITTDKPDYAPFSNAVFTGNGFAPNENVVLKVKNLNRPCNTTAGDSSYMPWTVAADATGHFETNWTVCDCAGDSLKLKATGLSSGLIAYAYFTDARAEISQVLPSIFSPNQSPGVLDIAAITGFNNGAIGGNSNMPQFNVRVKNSLNVLVWQSGNQAINSGNTKVFNWNGLYSAGAGTGFVPDGIYTAIAVNNNTESTSPASITKQIIVDNTLPVISGYADISINNIPGQCSALVSWSVPAVTDANPGTLIQTEGPSSGSSFSVGSSTTITYLATDAAGNTSSASFTVTVSDNQKPTITTNADQTINTGAGICGALFNAIANTEDNCGVGPATPVRSDNAALDALYPVGVTTITWTVTDINGNTETATQTITVTDNQKPTITTNGNQSFNASAGICGALFNPIATTEDNCGLGGTTAVRSDNAALDAVYPVGVTTITWTATDINGNTETATQTVTVNDTQVPTITAPANVVVSTDNNACSATNVALGTATSDDNCDGESVSNNAPASFPKGVTVVTWTVTDAEGNTATAAQTVTVNDTQAPSIIAPANVVVSTDNNACSATNVALGTATADDNCDGESVSNNAPASFPKGVTVITWTVTDAAGNTATATQTVTVNDTQAPTITCPSDIILSACQPTASWTAPVGSDNCPGFTVLQIAGPASGSTFAGGTTTTITYKVTDASGNSSTCTFTVSRDAAILINHTQTDVSCNGGNNGTINLTVSGGSVASSQVTISALTQNFNTLATSGATNTWADNVTLPNWYSNRTVYVGNDGSSATGGLYSFGTTSTSERALGSVASGGTGLILGAVKITNNTGYTVNSVNINYTGEQWRNSGNPAPQTLLFSYQINAASISSGTWSSFSGLNFTGPVATITAAALNGNSALNRAAISGSIPVTLNPGQSIWLRWSDADDSGTDHGLGIDDVSVSFTYTSAGYSYAWSNGSTAKDQSGLSAGNYSVTVTDAKGCTSTKSFTIGQPAVLANTYTTSNFNGYNISCNNGSNGSIDLTVTGGTAPYTYVWTGTGVNAASQDQSGLKAGTYTVTVTDSKGCTTNATITLTQPEQLTSSNTKSNFNGFNISCFGGNNGSIDLTPAGGVAPYSFAWTGTGVNASAEDQSGLTAGTYSVTITDANGCTVTASITLTQPLQLNNSYTVSNFNGFNISCFNGSNGSIDLTVTGGTVPYTYVWVGTGVNAAAQDQSGLTAGSYSVLVTDANGCTTNASFSLTQPSAISLSSVITNVNCFGESNGAINLSVVGGVANNPGGTVTYTQNFNTLASAGTSSSLPAGWFLVESDDNANNTYTAGTGSSGTGDTYSFGTTAGDRALGTLLSGSLESSIGAGSTFVNNTGSTVTSLTIQYTGEQWRLGTTGRADRLDFQYSTNATAINNGTWVNVDALDFSSPVTTGTTGALDGNLAANRTTKNGTISGLSIPPGATFWIRWNDFDATSADDGLAVDDFSMTMSSVTGLAPYTYLWTGTGVNASAEDQSNLTAGSYGVTVTDANGCTANTSYTVNQPVQVTVSATHTNASCLQNTDGTITVTASAGAAITVNGQPYNPSATYGVGTYTIGATAANGNNNGNCTATTSVNIVVEDVTPPVVLTKNITYQLNAAGIISIAPVMIDNGSYDACGIAEMFVSPNSFTCANVGNNTVTLTVVDVNGNSSTNTAVVTIVDKTAPLIHCPIGITVSCSQSTLPAVTGTPEVTEACGIASVNYTDVSTQHPDNSNPGFYNYSITRVWKATDIHGNSSTCTQIITVEDVTAPTAVCQNITLSLDANGHATIPASGNNTVFYNYSCDRTTSSFSNVSQTFTATASGYITKIGAGIGLHNSSVSYGTSITTSAGTVNYGVLSYSPRNVVPYSPCAAGNNLAYVTLPSAVYVSQGETVTIGFTGSAGEKHFQSGQLRLYVTGTSTLAIDGGSFDPCGPVTVTASKTDFNCENVGANNVILTVTDVSGNSATCTAVVTVQDNIAPAVLTKNITVQLNAAGNVSITASQVDNGSNDACGIATITVSPDNFTCANIGNNTVTLTVVDVNGNTATNTAVVTVQDKIAPVITCPADITISCQDSKLPGNTGNATATDACGLASIIYTDVSSQNPNNNTSGYYNYLITRTWLATDNNSNTSTCVQIITVQDITAPSISCPANITVNCQDSKLPANTGTATGSDNCSSVSITSTDVSTQDANPATAGHYNYTITRTWKATDVSGNFSTCVQVITVQDITAPSISCPANITVNCQDSKLPANTGTATGSDNCSSVAITSADVSTQDANPATAGHYNYTITRTWKATDISGNFTTCVQVITVQDITAPSISCPANITVNCQDSKLPANTGTATGSDNCSSVTISSSDVSTQDANPATEGHYNYTITRTWKATDVSGNFSTCVQVITVQDITAPSISCPANITVNCQDSKLPANTGTATGSDNCSSVSITSTDVSTQDANPATAGHYNYTITRTWKATDISGNFSTCIQLITVQDVTAPSITCPVNKTINCQDATTVAANGSATATDNCSPVSISSTDISTQDANQNAAGHYNYTITRTWKATDVSGNFSTCIQLITVQDVTAPSITCPANITINCHDIKLPSNTGSATGADICSSVAISYSDISTQNSNPNHTGYYNYTITRTWKSTDVSGNFTTCVQLIIVHDITAPTWTTAAGNLNRSVNCGNLAELNAAQALSPVATDLCSSPVSYVKTSGVLSGGQYVNSWIATDVSGNTSTVFTQIITVLSVNIDASASSQPVPVGSTATLSASVTTPAGAPLAGVTVTFKIDGIIKGTGLTNASGIATLPVSGLAVEVYKIEALAGNSSTGCNSSIAYLAIYDPSGGFVTGGGWITSPLGAYVPNPLLTGKANFGFVAKYKKGSTVPEGNTEFQFHAAGLNFSSTSYNSGSLVVAGAKAIYKGVGTINGSGTYGFMLAAIDGQVNGGGGIDKFRIKIWVQSTGVIVYDNNLGLDENGIPTTALGGGSIVIHEAKGGNSNARPSTEETDEPVKPEAVPEPIPFSIITGENPALTEFKITVNSSVPEPIMLSVISSNGRIMQTIRVKSGELTRFGKTFGKGMYILQVRQGSRTETLKLIKL